MDKYQRLVQLDKKVGQAQDQLVATLKADFAPGTEIVFDHHGYFQTGVVESVIDTRSYPGLRVKNNRTGKVRNVSVFDVIQAYQNI